MKIMIPAPFERPPQPLLLRWRWPLIWALAGAGALLLSRWLGGATGSTRDAVAWLGPTLSRPLSLLTGLVPVFVGEVLLIAYGAWLVALAFRGLRRWWTGQLRMTRMLESGARRIVRDTGVIVFAFYVLWGLNYARPPLERQLGWEEWSGLETEELVALATAAVTATNEAYLSLHGDADAGLPTALPSDTGDLEAAIDEGWRQAALLLSLPDAVGGRYGPAKWPLLSPALAQLGIAGIYFPFTAEANVVRGIPASQVPASMAHEKAHQRGIASEAEAGFLGFVAAALAPDPLSRYGAALFAQGQLLSALAGASPDDARRLAGERLPGVRRDLQEMAEYNRRFRGPVRAVGIAMNDRYLRANRVPGGVRNYGQAARLMVTWARLNEGRLLPAPPDRPGEPG
jgi:hypothetical protein